MQMAQTHGKTNRFREKMECNSPPFAILSIYPRRSAFGGHRLNAMNSGLLLLMKEYRIVLRTIGHRDCLGFLLLGPSCSLMLRDSHAFLRPQATSPSEMAPAGGFRLGLGLGLGDTAFPPPIRFLIPFVPPSPRWGDALDESPTEEFLPLHSRSARNGPSTFRSP